MKKKKTVMYAVMAVLVIVIGLLMQYGIRWTAGFFSGQIRDKFTEPPEIMTETQPVVTSPPVQTPVQTQPQNTDQTEPKYDATNLTIMAVPSTLSNYLDNKYELQCTLYDWLYRNGKQNVSTAAVDDFDIDPDDRVADIIFELDDGSTVYGSYDRDTNSYEYSF